MSLIAKIFAKQPGSAFNYYNEMIIIVILLTVAAIVINFIYRHKKTTDPAFKKLFKNTSGNLGWFALVIALLLMFRSENIAYFSMRLWLYITVIWMAYYVAKNIFNFVTVYPKLAQKIAEKPKKEVKKSRYTTRKK